jgi:glycosyltransferase involved in cell wall biosynthesis
VLDVRIPEGIWGGVQQAAIGLASGLSTLAGNEERYYFLAYRGDSDWLRPLLKGSCELVEIDKPSGISLRVIRRLRSIGFPRLARLVVRATDRTPAKVVSALRAQVVHFTHQGAFTTSASRIYQPHDLQHLHFPQFFSPQEVRRRNDLYLTYSRRSDMIAVMSRWGRADIVRQYDVDEAKIFVIPWAAPVDAYASPTQAELSQIRGRYELPRRYLLYPAQTWLHKNHIRLVQALKEAENRGLEEINLICTGHIGTNFEAIMDEVQRLALTRKVKFLGWIPSNDMVGVYRLAHGVVYPSLFEGWGLPVMEAFRMEIPVACSRIPVLQEQAGDAAIYFDPDNPHEMADTIISLWTNQEVRDRLVSSGRGRAGAIDWTTIAEAYRAHYRRLAGMPLDERDAALIEMSVSGRWLP